ncbi:MAG: cupin domain-containing protein [Candidatus Thorarchaeota archaeon]|nr:cupin domain-containing protein [Candidatus Thorarchaeota archaeon]
MHSDDIPNIVHNLIPILAITDSGSNWLPFIIEVRRSVKVMYVVNFNERDITNVDLPGAKNATVRWLIGTRTGALNYAMRLFEIAPGGIVPLHSHEEEHQIFVLKGKAKLIGELEGYAKKDDVVFVPPNEPHGYDNTEGTEVFRFICVIPLLNKK